MRALIGVDIGGTGIKAGIVDARRGALAGERVRVPTPQPADTAAVVAATAALVAGLGADSGPVGIGLPAVIKGGRVEMAANLDQSWIGAEAGQLFTEAIGRPVVMLNDADAAAVAEVRYGAGKGVKGVILMLTLGTGIGSAMFVDGVLVPNLELGHIEIRGKDAERRASAGARERRGLSWKNWAPLLNEYLDTVERLVWPDLIILGGGISKKPDKFVPYLTTRAPIVPATLQNTAGIVGAATRAREILAPPRPPRPRAPRTPTRASAPTTRRSRAGSAR